MSKSRSHTDQSAIFQHCFNEEFGALEVVLVGSELKVDNMTQNISVDNSKIESKLDVLIGSIKDVNDSMINCHQTGKLDLRNFFESMPTSKPQVVVQKEIQIVEVPTIVVQEKIVEVIKEVVREVPGPTKIEVVTVTVDREVVVTKTEYKDLSKLLIIGLVLQSLTQVILALLHK